MKKLHWGVLGAARIAVNKVIPALQRSQFGTVVAIASRDAAKGAAAARQHGIARVHASYEALLADPGVDAVYIPLPNHLHVPWSLKALTAGKHVLCEKPIALNAREAAELAETAQRFPQLKIMEAFMYRFHPQWLRARAIVAAGGIGELRAMHSHFSYWNVDPANVRNLAAIGGGAMMDIGCYCVSFARWIFDAAPRRVLGVVDTDPNFGTDRLASGLLDFGRGTASFTCATQLTPYQRAQIFGTEGRLEIEIPCNAPPDQPARLWHQRNNAAVEEITFPACDQYTLQGDAFARAVLDDTPVPTPLADAVCNMRVIESVLASARSGAWLAM
ncbi:MAG: Gfo/Idh/MocA family oxidoreductase [Opitutaceae bacterium]|nr:Gfo/Idh/MocA family oxidoreductase [Opitutaceae bacterium]